LRALRFVALFLALALAACASSRPLTGPNVAAVSAHPGLDCAPFARALSGVELRGDAYTWWAAAAGRYGRSARPDVGAVLVLRRSSRLPSGHVAVVSRVLGPRQALLIQANWIHGELTQDQLVVDVSERNDWTAVRMSWPPTGTLGGHVYEAYGFILPPVPTTHDALRRAAEPAARLAMEGGGGWPRL
jgi:hypothetical protein